MSLDDRIDPRELAVIREAAEIHDRAEGPGVRAYSRVGFDPLLGHLFVPARGRPMRCRWCDELMSDPRHAVESPWVRRALGTKIHEYIPDPRFDDVCRDCGSSVVDAIHPQAEDDDDPQ